MRNIEVKKAFEYKGRKCVILFMGHFCAYVETKLKGVDYNQQFGSYETSPESNIEAHGGVTFGASTLTITPFDKDIEYYGMDFAHCGDKTEYSEDGKEWTLEEVEQETIKMADSLILYEEKYDKYKSLFKKFKDSLKSIELESAGVGK